MASAIIASILHPSELLALAKIKLSSSPTIATGKNEDESYIQCYNFLNLTSRSFALVIQELHPQLRHAICLFYLVLRGLDTIEDDMTIAYPDKKALLLDFHNSIGTSGWTFDGNGKDEKDRVLLVNFHHVIT
jgi:farnesyl-diphosphate farnesyltransferase